jgi:hypothetical protein
MPGRPSAGSFDLFRPLRSEEPALPVSTDPVLKNARREGIWIGLAWLAATVYCCTYSALFGYSTPERPLGPADVHPIYGIPSWAFWGWIVPWLVCGVFTVWFAGFVMKDDDLGVDHSAELEADIREGAVDA